MRTFLSILFVCFFGFFIIGAFGFVIVMAIIFGSDFVFEANFSYFGIINVIGSIVLAGVVAAVFLHYEKKDKTIKDTEMENTNVTKR